MVPAQIAYDPETDQLVVLVVAAGSNGDVELLRMDVAALDQADIDRLAHVRDPDRPLPEPGQAAVTRRAG